MDSHHTVWLNRSHKLEYDNGREWQPQGKVQMVTQINFDRRRMLRSSALTLLSSLSWRMLRSSQLKLPTEGFLPTFRGATGWLNSEPIQDSALRGKVALVDFWTYSCINWRRTLPYLRAWDHRYGKHGLVVIGVHSPEFPFER